MKDFTEGSISRQLMQFSYPIILSNLLQLSMQLINGLWVGNLLGSAAFGAMTIATTIMVLVLAFVMGVNNATLTIFAQLRGGADKAAIHSYLNAFIIILCVLSAVIGIAGYLFAEPLLVLLNTPALILQDARLYLQINFIGTFLLVGYSFVGSVLRAFGDSRTPLFFVFLATVLTAVLSPLFVAVLGLGVAGAAYAIVLAQAAAFLYSLFYLTGKFSDHRFRIRAPKWTELWTILELSIPSGLQLIVIYAGMTVILALVNSLGPSAVAGFGAAQRLDNIILLPAVGLGAAVTAMAAQNIGAGQWRRVAHISKVGIAYSTTIMLLIAVILFVWAESLVRLFIQDEASVAFGVSYLKTIAFFYPFLGLNFIFNGVVRGAGAMMQILGLNIISLWILRVPLAWWATSLYGDSGVALGIGISFSISCLFSFAYYQWGGWRNKQLFK